MIELSPHAAQYSKLTGWRPECFDRFGQVLDLSIVPSPYDEICRIYRGGKILDVGAGINKPLQKALKIDGQCYYSLDSDAGGSFSFHSFAEVPEELRFDFIAMNQFLEHLGLDEACHAVDSAFQMLRRGGVLFVSVPNSAHPVRFHADVTHRTNWPFNDLYGLLRQVGFHVENISRSNKRPFPFNPLKRWLIRTICRELRVDWCDTIIIVGSKS